MATPKVPAKITGKATAKLLHQPLGGALCLDFVNTVDRTVGKPWLDNLAGYADLCLWSEQAGSLPRAQARALSGSAAGRAAAGVLTRARALREACFRVFLALAEGRAPAAGDLGQLNQELGEALGQLRVEAGGEGYAWAWPHDPGALDAPLWPIARSAGELLVSPARALVKRCGSATCLWLFLDETRNHQRRWCDMQVCGNRAKVRAHRARAARRRRRART
jgi:predicted RNA-binding Zn ribbon-like protein